MKELTLKDIYAGKPDAKDEINFSDSDEFVKTFVVADHFNLDSLIKGTNFFIVGFKGTGKTALLYYLDNLIKKEDSQACSSFIFFKEDFTDFKREEMQVLSKRLLSSISVEPNALIDNKDFEYIWRWLLFKRIVSDNELYGRNLFVDNDEWKEFESLVGQIKSPVNTRKSIVPNTIKAVFNIKDVTSVSEFTSEVEVDLRNIKDGNYKKFTTVIDEAETAFARLTRTDIPYYIFVDELEAYYGEDDVFKRDLCMIRDLIFTVKRMNTIFVQSGMKQTKIICSVRSEILNAIMRFVVAKEVNKITAGFSVPLAWNYSNNSYAHPIIQILLKRIDFCSEREYENSLAVYKQWFPETIHGIEPADYILNNSWCKPRDIVRLITAAQHSIHNNSNCFTQAVFNSITKKYSEESLLEIKEELRALYKSDEIDIIIACFTGYKTVFSIKQLKDRIDKFFPNTVISTKFNQVLTDLYRLGFLGNFLPAGKMYRWQHKGDNLLIQSEEWRLCVHYALHSALSIGGRSDHALTRGQEPQLGDVSKAKVYNVSKNFAWVDFDLYGTTHNGRIHISEFTKFGHGFIPNLGRIINIGDEFDVCIMERFDDGWNLEIILNDANKI